MLCTFAPGLGRLDVATPLLDHDEAVGKPSLFTRSTPLALACVNQRSNHAEHARLVRTLLRRTLDGGLERNSLVGVLSSALLQSAEAFALKSICALLEPPEAVAVMGLPDLHASLIFVVRAGAERLARAAVGTPFAEHALWLQVNPDSSPRSGPARSRLCSGPARSRLWPSTLRSSTLRP